jgi:hypothetical protein
MITAYSGAARPLRRAPTERKTVFILDLADQRVALNKPVPVSIELLTDSATACSPDTGDFAVAASEEDVLEEFRAGLVELYFLLKEEQKNLGPLPQRQWDFLRSVIVER